MNGLTPADKALAATFGGNPDALPLAVAHTAKKQARVATNDEPAFEYAHIRLAPRTMAQIAADKAALMRVGAVWQRESRVCESCTYRVSFTQRVGRNDGAGVEDLTECGLNGANGKPSDCPAISAEDEEAAAFGVLG